MSCKLQIRSFPYGTAAYNLQLIFRFSHITHKKH